MYSSKTVKVGHIITYGTFVIIINRAFHPAIAYEFGEIRYDDDELLTEETYVSEMHWQLYDLITSIQDINIGTSDRARCQSLCKDA